MRLTRNTELLSLSQRSTRALMGGGALSSASRRLVVSRRGCKRLGVALYKILRVVPGRPEIEVELWR